MNFKRRWLMLCGEPGMLLISDVLVIKPLGDGFRNSHGGITALVHCFRSIDREYAGLVFEEITHGFGRKPPKLRKVRGAEMPLQQSNRVHINKYITGFIFCTSMYCTFAQKGVTIARMNTSEIIASLDEEIARLTEARDLLASESTMNTVPTAPARIVHAHVAGPARQAGRPLGTTAKRPMAAAKPTNTGKKAKKRTLSPEGRKRIAEAVAARWARQKQAAMG